MDQKESKFRKKCSEKSENQQWKSLKKQKSLRKKKTKSVKKSGNSIANPVDRKKCDDYLFNLVPEQPKAISL